MLVRSGLGNMPWDVLTEGLSEHLSWSFGAVTVVLSIVVLLCWLPLRRRAGWRTVANIAVIGALVDPFLALLGWVEVLPLAGAVAMAAAAILLNGVATAAYIGVRLGGVGAPST